MYAIRSYYGVLMLVHLEAKALKSPEVNTGHLLLALLREKSSLIWEIMAEENINYQNVKQMLGSEMPKAKSDFPEDDDQDNPFSGSGQTGSEAGGKATRNNFV